MVVLGTSDGIRDTVRPLHSLKERKDVIFHIFCLPENCCLLLLVMKLGRLMTESVIWEEV